MKPELETIMRLIPPDGDLKNLDDVATIRELTSRDVLLRVWARMVLKCRKRASTLPNPSTN